MYHSLRKGYAAIYFQHQLTGHNIGADLFAFEVADNIATFRLHLHPTDENQRSDVQYLTADPLLSVTVNESQVVTGFVKQAKARAREIRTWRLSVVSSKKTYSFAVEPSVDDIGIVQVLVFKVVAEVE